MGVLLINISLALVWAAMTGQFTPGNLITGFLLGYAVLFLLRRVVGGRQYFYKFGQVLRMLIFFLWELLIANLRVARDVLRPGPLRLQPRVIAIPIAVTGDMPLLLLAVMVSLTPGTLVLDISGDRKTMFLHHIHAPDEEQPKKEIKQGFERQVIDLFSQPPVQGESVEERK
jgi:multicomponent Na+:H+ antiporter subunit E